MDSRAAFVFVHHLSSDNLREGQLFDWWNIIAAAHLLNSHKMNFLHVFYVSFFFVKLLPSINPPSQAPTIQYILLKPYFEDFMRSVLGGLEMSRMSRGSYHSFNIS